MMVIGLILVFAILMLIDIPYLLKNQSFKIILAYSFLMTLGLALSLILALDISITTPSQIIESIVNMM
ncbi:hypothetical protein [Syntrophomonas curvata]